ncbi:hypothetical protein BCR37DRAFT_377421 [Protomyces lactucae-debilis]|uniref:Uncharacterized protein n=1 Tax=Protomyces lactucae-debilis TaxID=2754530 RepID=A0A1Y2FP15_PROLT|nr:uncharacterized protein BCR37DRAFT_377421 [Protomyces lactucae-debilis]ORY85713.1 hypothetical protein BCR37DRAFT_377421 [Protomyces lactucae-debilis]
MHFFWKRRKSTRDALQRAEPNDLANAAPTYQRTRSLPVQTRHDNREEDDAHASRQLVPYGQRQKRHTSYTDTTIKSIDADARTIKIRRSGFIFSPKPTLRYSQDFNYPKTPEGQLPTLRRKIEASPFVDDIADELDTGALRQVLETDSRRRQRRQSKLLGGSAASGGSQSATAVVKASPARPPIPVIFQQQRGYAVQAAASQTQANSITGLPSDWHETSSIPPTAHARIMQDAQVVLAGNRDSYPDFAVVDKSTRVERPSSRGSSIAGAWTSLWKRAGSARARKERDVASHYNSATQSTGRPFSDTSSVLYNDAHELDQEPQQATIMVLQQPAQRASVQAAQDEEGEALVQRVPRAEHFEPRTVQAQMLTVNREVKTFSPLLDGDAFPRPPSNMGFTGIAVDTPEDVVAQSQPQVTSQPRPVSAPLWQRAYASPAAAAGISSPAMPRASSRVAKDIPPDESVLGDIETRANARQSVHSLQTVDSEGSWLGERTSHLDIMVKRSFSRKYEKRPGSAGSKLRNGRVEGNQDSADEFDDNDSQASTDQGEALINGTGTDDDDDEYERGVWKTGIGKPVKIVNGSSVGGPLPVSPKVAAASVQPALAPPLVRPITTIEDSSPNSASAATFSPMPAQYVQPIASASVDAISPNTPSTATFSPIMAQPAYIQPMAKMPMQFPDGRPIPSRATTRDSFVSAVSFATTATTSTVNPQDYAVYDPNISRASMVTSQASYYSARLAPESQGSERG